MELMFIEKLSVSLGNLKDVPTQPSTDGVGHQNIVAVDSILIRRKSDS
jgi:hypothetical protein